MCRIRCLVFVAALAAPAAQALPFSDNVQLRASAGLRIDDNVFRLPAGAHLVRADGATARGDTIRSVSAGIGWEVPISRQRLLLSYDFTHSTYDRFSELDFTGYEGRAVLRWEAGGLTTGELGATTSRALSSFTDTLGTAPNLRTTTQLFLTGSRPFGKEWVGSAGVSHTAVRNTNARNLISDSDSVSTNIGLKYVTGLGNAIGVLATHVDASFPNMFLAGGVLVDNSYSQDTLALTLNYVPGGYTTAYLQLGGSRRAPRSPAATVSTGLTGRAGMVWQVSGATEIALDLVREFSPPENVTSTDSIQDNAILTVRWTPTAKLRARGSAAVLRRQFGLGPTAGTLQRVDVVRYFSAGVDYLPVRNLSLGLSGTRESRTSSVPGLDYDANIGFASAQLSW